MTSPTTSSGSSESSSGSSSVQRELVDQREFVLQFQPYDHQHETSSSTTSTETTQTYDLPTGFDWWAEDAGLGYRGMDPTPSSSARTTSTSASASRCSAGPGCPAAATVEITVYPNATSDQVLGTANATTGPIPAGGTGQAIVGFDTTEADASAAVSNVICT